MPATRPAFVALLGLAAALALTGCAGGGGTDASASPSVEPSTSASPSSSDAAEGEQSVADACGILQDAATAIQTDVGDSLQTAQSDPAGAAAALSAAADNFTASVGEITNADVQAVAVPASESLSSFADVLSGIAADPTAADPSALSSGATELQTAFSAIATTCSAG